MKLFLILVLISLNLVGLKSQQESPKVIFWELNRLDTIGGFPLSQMGNPALIETEVGMAIEFDGEDDGLLIESNPLAGATEFTVEVIFKPYAGGLEEQRFVHMEQDNNNRALIELRSTPDDDWFLDTFIKSGSSSRTLYAENFPHATDVWWHAALVYKDSVMTHFVNGMEELSDSVFFEEVSSGTTSIGVRNNRVSWFKGAIRSLKITHQALLPEDFEFVDTTGNTPPIELAINDISIQGIRASLYPNPVSDKASLVYSVDSRSHIIIRVYDISNKLISEQINQVQNPGTYTTLLDCEELAHGIYFCSIKMDSGILTRKLNVIR